MAKNFEELRKELYRKDPAIRVRVRNEMKKMEEEMRNFERSFVGQLEELVWDPKFRERLRAWMRHAEIHEGLYSALRIRRFRKGEARVCGELRATKENYRWTRVRNRGFLKSCKLKVEPEIPVYFSWLKTQKPADRGRPVTTKRGIALQK